MSEQKYISLKNVKLIINFQMMTTNSKEKKSYDKPIKKHLVKAMVFPVVVYECESWAIK